MNNMYGTTRGGWRPADIVRDVATAWQMLWDPRVPRALKILLPAAALLYWISPIDLLPGLPFDDIALMILALRLFVQMAPSDTAADSGAYPGGSAEQDSNTIDTTWQVIDD